MNAIIFAGPSLSRDPVKASAGLIFRPPAANGDVYRAAREAPTAIGLVDGFFETVPSVWHKEILWAMAEGVHVFGAASMGALRAAELSRFGMIGVGAIFEAYRDGAIEDDDEVAVIHGPAELDHPPMSEPMVNVRATIARAVHESVLGEEKASTLLTLAKATFYKERTWASLLKQAGVAGIGADALAAFKSWLGKGAVDQKRIDARAMVDAIKTLLSSRPGPFRADFVFEETTDWQQAVQDFNDLSEG